MSQGLFCLIMELSALYDIYLRNPVISTDSRNITEGCLFFALKGANFNGNQFAEQAIRNGAAFAITDEDIPFKNERIIRVEDSLTALQKLAQHHRRTLGIPVIAITGSNGKTTSKELCSAVLRKKFRLHATAGNLNNHIGVPLTILSAPADTEMMFVEMGANHQGEIHDLCTIAEPDFGAITNIGKAHLEGFGGIEGVKKGKSEMYRFLASRQGKIFVNIDDKVLISLLPKDVQVIPYSTQNLCRDVSSNPYLNFTLGGTKLSFNTHMIGLYNLDNIALSIAMGNYFDIDEEAIRDAVCSYIPQNNRSQILKQGDITYILDAYNANPSSMAASIESFSNSDYPDKILILGDMLELGEESYEEHGHLLSRISQYKWEDVLLVGPVFYQFREQYPYHFFPDVHSAKAYFFKSVHPGCSVLLKGSRGIALEKLLKD